MAFGKRPAWHTGRCRSCGGPCHPSSPSCRKCELALVESVDLFLSTFTHATTPTEKGTTMPTENSSEEQELAVDRQLHGTVPGQQEPDSPEWFATLERARENGRVYADNGIAGGERARQESPLSGEWAGAITPRDVVNMAVGRDDAYEYAKDYEIEDLCNSWEDGYNSADWPDFAPGDEVEILIEGQWVGPYTVTDGEGRSPQHLVLRGHNVFEHYNDAPHNIRRVS